LKALVELSGFEVSWMVGGEKKDVGLLSSVRA
jgi:hypothetical protein